MTEERFGGGQKGRGKEIKRGEEVFEACGEGGSGRGCKSLERE